MYETVRELVMSYFHEYFENDTGRKSLRSFCDPVDLSIFDEKDWMTSERTSGLFRFISRRCLIST